MYQLPEYNVVSCSAGTNEGVPNIRKLESRLNTDGITET